jgi:hypothetical protein
MNKSNDSTNGVQHGAAILRGSDPHCSCQSSFLLRSLKSLSRRCTNGVFDTKQLRNSIPDIQHAQKAVSNLDLDLLDNKHTTNCCI